MVVAIDTFTIRNKMFVYSISFEENSSGNKPTVKCFFLNLLLRFSDSKIEHYRY